MMMNPMNTYNTFFECDFSRNFWAAIGMEWNTDLNTIEMLMEGAGGFVNAGSGGVSRA